MFESTFLACGCTSQRRTGSLLPYIILMLISTVLAIVLRYGVDGGLSSLYLKDIGCDADRCLGYSAVFRVSFATFFFFLTHGLMLLLSACWRLDRFSWLNKIVYWLALLVISFLMPEDFYTDFYVHVARVIAAIFLFLQIVILIDLAHTINEKWNSRPDEDPLANRFKALTIGMSLLALIASGVLLVLFYIWFGGSDCQLNQFFISFTLIITFILIVLSISEKFSEKGGLLPASIVTLYCYWLCYSGLSSDPSSCNYFGGDQNNAQLIIGLIIAAASITYAGWSVATHKNLFGAEEAVAARNIEDQAVSEVEMGVMDGAREAAHSQALAAEQAANTDEDRLVARRNFKFHCVMASASMYMAMVLTDWGSEAAASDITYQNGRLTGQAYDLSAESMWLKFASQWLTMLLYGWSIIAPVACKGRDFS